jgi:hypothetical protein
MRFVVFGVAAFLATQAAVAHLPASPRPDSAVADGVGEIPLTCNDAIYRFLPGEFNFCLAGRYFAQQRFRSAMEMLELAASWGKKPAQFALGLMYFNGQQVTADRPRGLAWLALAAERQRPRYLQVVKSAYEKATPAERRRAATLLAQLKPVYGDAVAARRAQRHFERAMRDLRRDEVYNANVCIAGLTGGAIDMVDPFNSICPPVISVVRTLDGLADSYFSGWQGHVTVGPAQTVPPEERK